MIAPTFADIAAAAARIRPYVHETPVMMCSSLNELAQAELYFKCENFQKVGAFKMRGATNAVMSLSAEARAAGVATHSSGNHGAALALAARNADAKATVVMPENAPGIKRRAVESYGAEIVFCAPTLASRESTLAEIVDRTGVTVVHPYNNPRVIAGQGTCALELCHQVHTLEAVIAPVGGGGLLSGTAITVTSVLPHARVYGAEPANADDAYRSFHAGRILPVENPKTIADGLRTSLGSLTFPIIKERVTDILTVSEEQIVQAMRLVYERMKLVIEPSAAVPVAAMLSSEELRGKRVGVILSGGNVDLDALPWGR